jgi:hypothetical protein
MNIPLKNPFTGPNQKLVEQYEKLRAEALDTSKSNPHSPQGFSILLFRGMASWIEACLYSDFSQASPSPSNATSSHQILNMPPYPTYKEASIILTNMILSHQKERRNNYA